MKYASDEFRQFVFSKNVLELAAAVTIGFATWTFCNAFTNAFVLPFIAELTDERSFGELSTEVWGATLYYGLVIGALVSALLAGVIVALVVVRRTEDLTQECPYCLSRIHIDAVACAFCTRDVDALEATE